MVALDADTGKLKWYFQFTPHDEFDYDSVQVPVLAANGLARAASAKSCCGPIATASSMCWTATTGQFLLGKPFAKVNWATGLDERGRPMRARGMTPSKEGTLIYPGPIGGTNWYSPSYSPHTGFFYIPTWDELFGAVRQNQRRIQGRPALLWRIGQLHQFLQLRGIQLNSRSENSGFGVVRAMDPKTGERKWEFKMTEMTDSGILTTASDLLFTGNREGYFMALNARDGTLLWKVLLGSHVSSGPMSYSVNGKQYVAVAAGSGLFVFGLR